MGCLPYFRDLNDRKLPTKEPRRDLEFWKWVLMIAFRPLTRFQLLSLTRRPSPRASAPEFLDYEKFHSSVTGKCDFSENEGRMPGDDVSIDRRFRRKELAPQARPSRGKQTK